jgi:nucleotide-binding universal stress UspA family protein
VCSSVSTCGGHASRAIEEAFAEASSRKVALTAVYAWSPALPTYLPPGDFERTPEHQALRVALAEQLAGYRTRYPDVEVLATVVNGEPDSVLLDMAAEHELLVVARHKDRVGTHHGLGATARLVLDDAECPVLVTPSSRAASLPRHRHAHQGVGVD